MNEKNPNPQSEEEAAGLLAQEALALALAGRGGEALVLLDTGAAALEEKGEPELLPWLFLSKARILLSRGTTAERQQALQALEKLVSFDSLPGWLAALELARVAREEARLPAAASLLQHALDGFRRHGGNLDEAAECSLEKLVTREVLALQRAFKTGPLPHPPSPPFNPQGIIPEAASLLRLVEFGRNLARESDPDQVLRLVLHEAIEFCGAERGFVVLARGDQLVFSLAENVNGSAVPEPVSQISRTLVREVLATGKPVYIGLGPKPKVTAAEESLLGLGIRFAACVPIGSMGATVGVLYFDRPQPPPQPSAELVRLLDLFAGQAAAALQNAWERQERDRELQAAREAIRRHRSEYERRMGFGELVGASDSMQDVYRKIERVIPTTHPVLIEGETGTGKELVARLIHAAGPRSSREFVTINCGALPDSLLEDELFGHEKGAFSGADSVRPGLFELADGGTLLLDEVAEMSPRMQAALLRVLDLGETRRLGGRDMIHVDVRVLAATHTSLAEAVKEGSFRQDLLFRLRVLSIKLPPLRDRIEDIPLLVPHLLRRLAPGRPQPILGEAVMQRLLAYTWPGNIRELENVLRRFVVLGARDVLIENLPPEILAPSRPLGGGKTLHNIECEAVRQALEMTGGNRAAAARLLGIDPKTLRARLREAGEPIAPQKKRELPHQGPAPQ